MPSAYLRIRSTRQQHVTVPQQQRRHESSSDVMWTAATWREQQRRDSIECCLKLEFFLLMQILCFPGSIGSQEIPGTVNWAAAHNDQSHTMINPNANMAYAGPDPSVSGAANAGVIMRWRPAGDMPPRSASNLHIQFGCEQDVVRFWIKVCKSLFE